MMLDKNLLVSDMQSVATTVATLVSDGSIDLGTAGTIPGLGGSVVHDVGRGARGELLIQVTETVTGGASTIQFQLIESDSADLSGPVVVAETPAIAKATLVAGYRARLALPVGITKRYIGAQYVVAGATTTAGKVTAGIAWNTQQNPAVA